MVNIYKVAFRAVRFDFLGHYHPHQPEFYIFSSEQRSSTKILQINQSPGQPGVAPTRWRHYDQRTLYKAPICSPRSMKLWKETLHLQSLQTIRKIFETSSIAVCEQRQKHAQVSRNSCELQRRRGHKSKDQSSLYKFLKVFIRLFLSD